MGTTFSATSPKPTAGNIVVAVKGEITTGNGGKILKNVAYAEFPEATTIAEIENVDFLRAFILQGEHEYSNIKTIATPFTTNPGGPNYSIINGYPGTVTLAQLYPFSKEYRVVHLTVSALQGIVIGL